MKKLSVILLSYFSEQRITSVYNSVNKILGEAGINFEFIVIDDGSSDNSYKKALELEKEKENVKAFQLSRNFTSHYALFAGLSLCTGDCAVAIPDDEQQPYNLLIELYRKWEEGNKIVIPYRLNRNDPFISKYFSKSFYFIMNNLSDIKYPPGGADSFLIDREIIDLLNTRIHPINTTTITEVLRLGFEPFYLPYERVKGNNEKSRWTFRKKWKLALDTFYSSSSFPIKFISTLGVFFSIFSFTLIIFYSYINIFGNKTFWGYNPPGWTSTVLFISFFSGLILFALGIIAEYIWRIYEEVKNRPGYIIKNKGTDEKIN
jgi:dolichol-phosphate mannosyltransferase